MALLSRDELRTLAETTAPECVSLYLPTHRTGRDLRQDPIRLKNLLVQTEERLQQRGLRGPDARDFLQPLRRLFDDDLFWRHLREGLALFLTRDQFHHYDLPLMFEEQAVVNSRFHLKPLLPLLSGDGLYYLLILSQSMVQLYEGSRYSIRAVDLAKLPKNLAEALQGEYVEKQLQYRTRGGDRDATFHGHGTGKDDRKDRLLRYFRQIDNGLHDFLKNKNVPLVLAGVDYYLPIYREANTYANLMSKGVSGNHQEDHATVLHGQSWQIIEPLFIRPREEAFERLQQLAGSEKCSTKLGKILPAAHQGKIAMLFVALNECKWGRFDASTQHIQSEEEAGADREDLYDLAAVQTFLTKGVVYVAGEENTLNGEALAAIFRY